MKFYWNEEKNKVLKITRNITFEDIEKIIQENGAYDVEEHPNQEKYPHQKILCVEKDEYMFVIPCVSHEDGYFLKTIYPSRRVTKRLLSHKVIKYETD